MTLRSKTGAILCTAALSFATTFTGTAQADDFYEGKTIEIIVGFEAGGGTDSAARIIARHLGKHIPGEPNVIIKNMPGGGTLLAQNYIYERAKPDGLTIGFNPFQVMAQVTEREGVRFNYSDSTFIAGVLAPGFMAGVRHDIAPGGIHKPEDIKTIDQPLKYTGRTPLHSIDVLATAAFDLLGMEHVYVPGYNGSADLTTSMVQNETNISGAGSIHWLKHLTPRLIDEGEGTGLFQFGVLQSDGTLAPDPGYPGVPLFRDFYKQALGTEPSGPLYEAFDFAERMQGTASWIVVGPPEMDPEATAILREAYAKAVNDPETVAETLKVEHVPYGHIGFDIAEGILAELANTDPAIAQFWKDRLAKQSGGY
ncbi:hypothetical protein IV417_01085 [Alphaproteobacteria bacterium KMM 3653]|uniref:Tripartite-type tricarboxylate transporter receptor subunit TctC n=1 Tax=Harenicola maris TaxID=2841044 RepID=A0AAP2CLP2_9RHOB|nr:hypothetical protein [Harenicola maris]